MLRGGGRQVLLIAPAAAGAAIVGTGSSEAHELFAWERPEIAALFAEEAPPPAGLRERLAAVDLAVVYSRSAALVRGLQSLVAQVAAHDPTPAAGVHASRWLLRPLEALGFRPTGDPEPIRPTAPETAEARRFSSSLPAGFLAVHPGSGSPRKNWPADRFAALLDTVAPRAPFLLVEGPADAEAVAVLRRRPGAVVAHGLPPRMLGAVLSRAGVFIGHDSGVSHLAAAWGTPTVALFGPTDPAVWAPLGPRVAVVRAPGGSMAELEVAPVAAACRPT